MTTTKTPEHTDDSPERGEPLQRCISCQAFLGADAQDASGIHCAACGDEVSDADMEANGWEFDDAQRIWARAEPELDDTGKLT